MELLMLICPPKLFLHCLPFSSILVLQVPCWTPLPSILLDKRLQCWECPLFAATETEARWPIPQQSSWWDKFLSSTCLSSPACCSLGKIWEVTNEQHREI